jgi:hypothetical protein
VDDRGRAAVVAGEDIEPEWELAVAGGTVVEAGTAKQFA